MDGRLCSSRRSNLGDVGFLQLNRVYKYMTSDHRVAGSSPAGCKTSSRADLQALIASLNLNHDLSVGRLLDVFQGHGCIVLSKKLHPQLEIGDGTTTAGRP